MEFTDIVLETHEFDLDMLKSLEYYVERRYPDAVYLGQFINGKRHGKGVMRYKNGR